MSIRPATVHPSSCTALAQRARLICRPAGSQTCHGLAWAAWASRRCRLVFRERVRRSRKYCCRHTAVRVEAGWLGTGRVGVVRGPAAGVRLAMDSV